MNDQIGPGSLLDTTDSLEAVGVFRGWKNLMFLIVFLCLLLTQGAFWLVNTGWVGTDCKCCVKAQVCPTAAAKAEACPTSATKAEAEAVAAKAPDPNKAAPAPADPNKPAVTAPAEAAPTQTAKEAVPTETVTEAAPTETATDEAAPKSVLNDIIQKVTIHRLCFGLTIVNAVLILSACIYVLTILFSLKVSIVGKLGGINHISRAFFIALFMFVLLLPWQRIFGGMVVGMIYTPCELVKAYKAYPADTADLFTSAIYYLRFCGYWLLIFFMLILTQMRTSRWTRAILRRLEVV